MRRPPAGRRSPLHFLVAVPVLLLASCAGGDAPGVVTPEIVRARDRAADHGFRGKEKWNRAVAILEPLVADEDAPLEDLLRMACAQLAIHEGDPVARAEPYLARAERIAPRDPVVLWCRYQIAVGALEHERALELLRALSAQRPELFTVTLALAQVLNAVDASGNSLEIEALYRKLIDLPPEVTGVWRPTVLYQFAQLLQRTGREKEAEPLFAEHKRLTDLGVKPPDDPFHAPGTLGAIPPHTPGALERPAPAPFTTRYASEDLDRAGLRGLRAYTLQALPLEDVRPPGEEVYRTELVPTLVAFGADGVELLAGPGAPRRLLERAAIDVAPFDRMNHGADKSSHDAPKDKKTGDRELDLLALVEEPGGAGLYLLENVGGSWSLRPDALATFASTLGAGSLVPVDFDHEGDVDLLVATSEGLRLLRNDGLEGSGTFTDATPEAHLPAGSWLAITEDVDGDNAVDFLLRSSGACALAANERGGRFSDASASLPAGLEARWLVPADFDADGRTDLAAFGHDLALHTRHDGAGWRAEVMRFVLSEAPSGEPRAVDLDLDGACDLVWPVASRAAVGLLAAGFPNGGVPVTLGEPYERAHEGEAELAFADVDGDYDLDFMRRDGQGATLYRAHGAGNGLQLALLGYKDNARGVGAIVELRSGGLYRRLYTRGIPELVGFDGQPVDMARITWPNGVVHGDWDLGARKMLAIAQWPGQPGSCPLLYTWNGTTYEFISDVLGITPLGLPMTPGMPGAPPFMVPPDHDEYVLVKGEQLVPKDGVLELHLTEELREVTYLDRIRLDVVDHPADVEVFPNERFTFPPFPEAHTHTVKDALTPLTAVDQDGRDWRDELERDDRRFAIPFASLGGQYRGLASAHTLELAFAPERVRSAAKLRLFLNGWFVWTDASVNVAAARAPDVEFVPPTLTVPDGQGGWRECGPIGFPAGKLKTMVVDVTALLNRDDPRLRLSSTLCLYWDRIRLALDADDAPFVTTALEPTSALLWLRGFSRAFGLGGDPALEWFAWDSVEQFPRWNQHPGLYTRLGETLPLVTAIDDRFVVMGAGDALTVRFDATRLPPLPAGWRRDYLVFLDGWAKDRDPNTLEALYVEPLPFHGMSGYPYDAGEHYPDDEVHRAYRHEWNTRPARQWIQSLVPPRPVALAPVENGPGAVARRD